MVNYTNRTIVIWSVLINYTPYNFISLENLNIFME